MLKEVRQRNKPVSSEVVTITPEIASAWLEQNTHNRRITKTVVMKYAADMASGSWWLTGDPIRFAPDGRLLDGQHRLNACIKSGANFTSFVVYGLPDMVQDVIDAGKSRSAGDMLTLRGLTNANATAAACRVMLSYKNGWSFSQGNRHSNSAVRAVMERHPNITKSVTITNHLPRGLPRATVAFVHYAATFLAKQAEDAETMVDVLKTGYPSYPGDVMHYIREKFMTADPKPGFDVAVNTFLRTWEAFVKKENVRIQWVKRPFEIDGLDRDLI